MTFKFNGWPCKTIWHLFYAMWSFVNYFKASSEFKLELQSRNAQFGSKSAYFFAQCVLEIWWMTLKNNRAPLLCYFNLCVWSHSHWSIQTGVTVWKCPIQDFFLFRATLKFYGWPWKTIGHLFYAPLSFVHHFIATDEFKLELQSRNSQFGSKSEIFCPVWLWNLMDDLQKQ